MKAKISFWSSLESFNEATCNETNKILNDVKSYVNVFIALRNYIYLQVSTRPLRVPQPMVRSEGFDVWANQ